MRKLFSTILTKKERLTCYFKAYKQYKPDLLRFLLKYISNGIEECEPKTPDEHKKINTHLKVPFKNNKNNANRPNSAFRINSRIRK